MSSLKKNFIYNTTYQLLNILIPIITMPYISRTLGAEKVGDFSYYNAIAYYFTMFIILGLNNYGNRTIAENRDNKETLSKLFFEIYCMQIICGIIVIFLYVLFCVFVSNNIISWILLLSVFSSVIDINWLYFGLEKFQLTVSRSILIKIISTISILAFVKDYNDLNIYAFILCFSTLLSNIIIWLFLKQQIIFTTIRISDVKKHIKPNFVLFIPIIAISLYKYMDKIMLGLLSGMSQVGYYEYSEKILQIPMALVNSLAVIMLPRMSNIVASSKKDEEKKYIEISVYISMFLATSLCFGLMGIAKQFVPLFYGSGFEPCVDLFYILLPSCCFVSFASVIRSQYLIPHKEDKVYILSICAGAIFNFILNIILIPKYNAIGAAIGTLVAEGTVCIYQCLKTYKFINIKGYIMNSLCFIFSGIIMLLFLLAFPMIKNDFITIICKIFVGTIIYIISLLLIIKNSKQHFGIHKKLIRHFLISNKKGGK